MSGFAAVTDEDIARARADIRFKQDLMTTSLAGLLSELNRLKQAHPEADAATTRQIREAVTVAVQLSDRLRQFK